MPFAAFYYCQTPNLSKASVLLYPPNLNNIVDFIITVHKRRDTSSNSDTPPRVRPPHDFHNPPLHLSLKLAGSIGVPDTHPATPLFLEIELDPITYKPHIGRGPIGRHPSDTGILHDNPSFSSSNIYLSRDFISTFVQCSRYVL